MNANKDASKAATVTPPITQPKEVKALSEDELVDQMRDFIKKKPRSWYDIVRQFAGQPYPPLYRAFGRLRHELGRREDMSPEYPYTFAKTDFVTGSDTASS